MEEGQTGDEVDRLTRGTVVHTRVRPEGKGREGIEIPTAALKPLQKRSSPSHF